MCAVRKTVAGAGNLPQNHPKQCTQNDEKQIGADAQFTGRTSCPLPAGSFFWARSRTSSNTPAWYHGRSPRRLEWATLRLSSKSVFWAKWSRLVHWACGTCVFALRCASSIVFDGLAQPERQKCLGVHHPKAKQSSYQYDSWPCQIGTATKSNFADKSKMGDHQPSAATCAPHI